MSVAASRRSCCSKPLVGSREQVWKQRQRPCVGVDDDDRALLAAAVDKLWHLGDSAQVELQVYASLLQQCADAAALDEGRRVHAHIVHSGTRQSRFVSNFLVHMYGKCKQMEAARAVFEATRRRNVFSYTILLDAYAECGRMQEARQVFERMPSRNTVSWTSMVSGYGKNNRPGLSRAAFDSMPEKSSVAWTAMMTAYTHNGEFGNAIHLFRLMDLNGCPADDVTFLTVLDACTNLASFALARLLHAAAASSGVDADPKVANSFINLYGKCGWPDGARAVFDVMHGRTVVSWSTMIAVYAHNGRPQQAKAVFDATPLRNVIAWNALIAAYADNGHCETALNMFALMDADGTPADTITFLTALDACAAMPSLARGRLVHGEIAEQHLASEQRLTNAVLHMYSQCGSLRDVVAAFQHMEKRDLLSWNTIAAAFAHLGHGERTLDVLRFMLLDGVQPDGITFIAVLSGCCHAGLLHDGVLVFIAMAGDYGVPAERDHYNCLVDLLCRASMLKQAEEVACGGECDAVPWNTLLNACKAQSDVSRGARAALRASQLAPAVSAPYVMLSALYGNTLLDRA